MTDNLHLIATVLFLVAAAIGLFAWRRATTPRMRMYSGGSAAFCFLFGLFAATNSLQRSLAPAFQMAIAVVYLIVAIAFLMFLFRFGPRRREGDTPPR